MNKRMIFMVLMVVFFSGVVIQTVEAGIFDPFTSGSSMFVGKAKTFQSDYLTKQRIANYFVLGIVFILLGTAYFKWGKSDSSGSSDGSQQYFYYVLLFILAIIVVIQVVDDPTQYIWEKEMVQDTKEFLIGGSGCRLEEGGVFTSAINIKHGYTRKAGSSNELICKHPILRTGEGGRGLPVFLIAFIVILLVLKKYQKKLGFEGLDDSNPNGSKFTTSKMLYYGLSFMLASMIATSGHTRDGVLRFAGWVIVMLLYMNFTDKSKGEGIKNSHAAFGLSVAVVETILNLFDSGLFFDRAGEVTLITILINFGLGFGLSFYYGKVSARWKKWDEVYKEKLDTKSQKEFDAMFDEDKYPGMIEGARYALFGSKKKKPSDEAKEELDGFPDPVITAKFEEEAKKREEVTKNIDDWSSDFP